MTTLCTLAATYLFFNEGNMSRLVGIRWSAPSPIEWGTFILFSTFILMSKTDVLEAFYLSFIAAIGGAWLYEYAPMLFGGFDWFVFFKVNAVKVFFMEFQLFCLPLLYAIIIKTKEYKPHFILIPAGVFMGLFAIYSANTLWISRWIVRLPTIFFLFFVLLGIKGDKNEVK